MKVLPRHINFSETAPTSVEEMKDGEMIVTPDGIYARVGDQVLYKAQYQVLPSFLTCDVIESYYRMIGDTYQIDIDGETFISIDGDTLTKTGTSPQRAGWSIEARDYENYVPMTLPLMHFKIKVTENPSATDEHVFSLQGDYPVNRSYLQVKIDDGGGFDINIRVERKTGVEYWVEGSGWQGGSAHTGETWTINEWWTVDLLRSGSQWRVSIKDELDAQVILTDWIEWIDLDSETDSGLGGNIGRIVLGYETSGPGGLIACEIKDFAICYGFKRFAYTNFSTASDIDPDILFTPYSSGPGATVDTFGTNLQFIMNPSPAEPAIIERIQEGWANTGISDLDEFDVWAQLVIPSGRTTEAEHYLEHLLTAYNSGEIHEAGLRMRWTGSQYQVEYRAVDGTYTDDWTAIPGIEAGRNTIYIRMRFLPSQGDTEIKMYFSKNNPTSGYGWVPIIPATASPHMNNLVRADGVDYGIKGYNNDSTGFTMYTAFLSDSRLATFNTTTTTTTTT